MNVGSVGRSLELFFIDGKPDGMQTAEMFNWTGHVLLTPRTRVKAALERKESRHTGIYLLLGEKDGRPFAYIGEGENIAERIKEHNKTRDWWTHAALVSTGANTLNKAHVKYLEARLVEIALSTKQRDLENSVAPARPSLSEAALSNMEAFLEYLLMVLPALRIDLFLENTKQLDPQETASCPTGPVSPEFELVIKKNDLAARARLIDGEFVVLQGSTARLQWEGKGSWDSGYAKLHEDLVRKEVLVPNGDRCVFAKSYAFQSVSAAAAVVTGRPAAGTTEWKIAGTDQTYKDWEREQLESVTSETP